MIIVKRKLPLLCVFVFVLWVANCSSGTFTAQEKREVKHFKEAQRLYLEASRYLKKITEGNSPVGIMEPDELNTFIEKLTEALRKARLVSDAVLNKIHPKLPAAYHAIFIPCIENQIHGFKNYDPLASIMGQSLHNEWVDWWNSHYREFRTS